VVKEVLSQFRKLSDKLPSRGDLVGIIGVLIVILLLLALTFNVRKGPQGQVMGTVHGATFAQGDGPASKVVSIHLNSGDFIVIEVSPNRVLQPGQLIVLDVYRRFLTGSLTYGMAPSNKQPTPETVPSLHSKALP